MRIQGIFVFLLAALVAPLSFALNEANTTIAVVAINNSGDVAVMVNNPSSTLTNNCNYNMLSAGLTSVEDRAVYSTLLAAKIANSPVTISYTSDGSNDCTLHTVNVHNE